jgi:NAD(P)-dependent dehydrogenase (short-subunit alcohol dehydrogenase family)
MSLQGRTALVTGSSSGIGRAIALRFAREGADLVINGRDAKKIDGVVKEVEALKRRALGIRADVASFSESQAMVERAVKEYGHLDILVCSAGIFHFSPFLEITEKEWDEVLTVDVKGMFSVSQAALRSMVPRKWGRIIFITAVSGIIGVPHMGHICTAKWASHGLAASLALEFAKSGVTVNVIAPGPIDTPLLAAAAERMRGIVPGSHGAPVGRIGKPDEIAAAAAYLASEEAAFTTGQVINVSGGLGI